MSQANVEIVQEIYDTWNRSGGVPQFDSIDPEIEAEIVGGLDAGSYRGHAGLVKLLDAFWDSFGQPRIVVEESIPVGDGVLVTVHYYGRGKASGVEVDLRGWHTWTLRDGRAVSWRIFGSRREALEAAGLTAQDAHADSA
jgi:ketosteroid isomerase-like protein